MLRGPGVAGRSVRIPRWFPWLVLLAMVAFALAGACYGLLEPGGD